MSRPLPTSTAATAWNALVILTGLNLFNYLDRYVMSAVVTPMQKDLALSDRAAGSVAAAFMLSYLLCAPVFGYVGDRHARKYLMLASVVVWSMATAACGFAQNFTQLYAARLIVGVGEACFVTMAPSWISDCFAAARRNTALSFFYAAIPFGSAIGFVFGGLFAQHGDWRGAFIYAGLPGVVLALSLLLLREPARGEADGLAPEAVIAPHVGEIAGLMLNRRYALLVWGYAAQTFAIGAFGVWGPTFLYRIHGMDLASSATIFGGMLAGTGLVATLLGGMLANMLRRRTAAAYVWVMALSLVIAVPLCFLAVMAGDRTLSLVGFGASMFFIFLPTGPLASEMFEIVPVHLRASAVAVSMFVIHLFGDFISPTIVGQLSTQWASLQKAVLVLPAALVLGAVLWGALIAFTHEPEEVKA
jgi:MFS family permease